MTTSAGPAARTRIVLRPLGSSLPLGFFAFGVGVLLTGLLDLRALTTTDTSQVAVLLLTFRPRSSCWRACSPTWPAMPARPPR